MTLYELNEKLANFQLDIDEETGEILNAAELDQIELEREEKIENVCLMIKNLKAEAEMVKAEKDNLAKREKSAKSRAEWLTNYLQDMLQGETYKTAKVSVSYRKSESLEVNDISYIPDEFLRYKDPEVNKTDLKKAIKNGLEVKGVRIVENNNISVK